MYIAISTALAPRSSRVRRTRPGHAGLSRGPGCRPCPVSFCRMIAPTARATPDQQRGDDDPLDGGRAASRRAGLRSSAGDQESAGTRSGLLEHATEPLSVGTR